MLCRFYSFASFVMLVSFCPLFDSITTISISNSSANQLKPMYDSNNHNISIINFMNNFNASDADINKTNDDLSASSAQLLSWIIGSDGDYVNQRLNSNYIQPNSVNITNNSRNSSLIVKRLINVLNKNENRREDDLGLPPDIANEYIDTVNPPKFRIPVHYNPQLHISSSVSPLNEYLNRIHAGSSVVSTKMNYSTPLKPNDITRNTDIASLLKAEFDAKKAELDLTKSYTPAPNLFALLPAIKTENPFLESNYKTPNRVKTSTNRPYVTPYSDFNNNFNNDNNNNNQFIYNEGIPIQMNKPIYKPNIAIATPNSIHIISTVPTKLPILSTGSTMRPIVHNNKGKTKSSSTTTIKTTTKTAASPTPSSTTLSTTSSTAKTTTTTTTTTTTPTISLSSIASISKQNKSSDWSLRVNNQSIDGSIESNDSKNLITVVKEDKRNQSHEPFITVNTLTQNNKNNHKVINDDYESEANSSNSYNDFDYADNTLINPNYTVPDGFSDHPGATYRLTTERLAYILIGSCCALSILCLIVVAMSVRCRDMCDEYRSWKKAEKAALRWQRHQYRLAHHQQDLSRYFRTSVEANQDSNTRPNNGQIGSAPAPMFGPTCCHCINCSSSWLFRDVSKSGQWCCQRGYYHPAPRGKLPFGAASSVNTFMPRYANNTNINFCDEGEDTDSLNASDFIDNQNVTHHNRQQHHFGERPVSPSANSRPTQNQRHQQLRRIAQPNGNPSWIHSSELVDELHKKHCNTNHISREQIDQQNINNFRARNRQHLNENVVVWNNTDERLI